MKFAVHFLLMTNALAWGCSSSPEPGQPGQPTATVQEGETVIEGEPGTEFEGVRLVIPAGAVPSGTEVEIESTEAPVPLPDDAVSVGPWFRVLPTELESSTPMEFTLPFDNDKVTREYDQSPTMVKVWAHRPDLAETWETEDQLSSTDGTVTVPLELTTTLGAGLKLDAPTE